MSRKSENISVLPESTNQKPLETLKSNFVNKYDTTTNKWLSRKLFSGKRFSELRRTNVNKDSSTVDNVVSSGQNSNINASNSDEKVKGEQVDLSENFILEFVSSLPAIDSTEARIVAQEFNLISSKAVFNNTDRLNAAYAKLGLKYCRMYGVGPEELAVILEDRKEQLSALDLFEKFNDKSPDVNEIMDKEKSHRESRDKDILDIELLLLSKRGIETPKFSSLLEYCSWIPESTGYNERIKRWAKDSPSLLSKINNSRDVYWDLQNHYFQIINGARKSFNPSQDWRQYLDGNFDINRAWNLQNMGKEDISYYSISMQYGGGAVALPSRNNYDDPLITHSTSLDLAQDIIRGGYLTPRVCYSSGQVVSIGSPSPEVVFIFPRSVLEKTYVIAPFTEPGAEHEFEIRSNEENNINLAIACVPLSKEIFPDSHGSGAGTDAIGRGTISRWGSNYLKTGKLWDIEEEAAIKKIAKNHSSKIR